MTFIASIVNSDIQNTLALSPNSATSVNTILQCFVNQNLETNENTSYNYIQPSLSFDFDSIILNEGDSTVIRLGLDSPSILGIEEADLYFINSELASVLIPDDVELSININEPLRLSWSAGQQYKFINITAKNDFLIDNNESFNLKLNHFVNCTSGNFSNLSVNIQNTTTFLKVGIESTDGYISQDLAGAFSLQYNLNEGNSKDIKVSLNSPSIFGIEQVDLIFTPNNPTSSADYTLSELSPIRLLWSIGEQTKTISLSANSDTLYFESDIEELSIELRNPSFVDIVTAPSIISSSVDKFPTANAYIKNIAPGFEYTRVYLGPFATQPGRIAIYPNYNSLKPYGSYSTNGYNYLINNIFQQYQPNALNTSNFQGDILNNFNKSKLKVSIKNTGSYSILYNNVIWNTGQTLFFIADTQNYFVDLPANLNQNTATNIINGSSYKIDILMTYTGNSPNNLYYYGEFQLKGLSNTLSTDKIISLGNQVFNSFSVPTFSSTTNSYQLVTKFSNIGTGRFTTYLSPLYCPSFSGFDQNKVEDVALNGMYFVDINSQTDYIGLEFRQNGGISPTCNNSQYTLPFEVLL